MQEYSLKIADAVISFLKADDWNHREIDENGNISLGVSLKCKFQRCDVDIHIYQDSFTVTSVLPLTADVESRPAVLDFLNRANDGFIHGNFQMRARDGEIAFRTSHYCGNEDILISEEIVRKMLYVNLLMVERYGTPLLTVMMGTATPEEAIQVAEAD